MKVIIIANGFQADYIENLVPALADHVSSVEFVGSDIYSLTSNSKVQFINLRGSHKEDVSILEKGCRVISYYIKLVFFLINSKASVVHIQWIRFPMIDGVIVPLFVRALGKISVYTAHNVVPHNTNGDWIRRKFKLVYWAQNLILVHTEFIKKEIRNKFNIDSEKIEVVRHGVYHVEDSKETTQIDSQRLLNIPMDRYVVLFFGRISKYKGFDLLISASEKISPANRPYFIIAGRVNEDYKREFDSLRERCSEEDFRFLSRHLTSTEVQMCFKASDVCVLPYTEASQSGVLFMSYAYGIPVIAPRLGGFEEDVLEGKTGLLFSAGDSESLAQTLERSSTTKFFTREEIKNHVNDTYSWNVIGSEIAKLYLSWNA